MLKTKPMLKRMCNQYLIEEVHILYLITSSQRYDLEIETSLCMMTVVTIMIDQVFFQFSLTLSNFMVRGKIKLLDPNDLQITHRYVLMNCPEVEPYMRRFTSQLHSNVPSMPRQ